MNFQSDNVLGCAPEILDAIARANAGSAPSYGKDAITERLRERVCAVFEAEVDVVPVVTGTAANALSVAVATPGWGAVYCHRLAHVYGSEFGAAEFYSGGAKLLPMDGSGCKIDAVSLERAIDAVGDAGVPACVSLTQATEAGTVYRLDEIRAIADVAHRRGLVVQMDGARFANAVVSLNVSPADLAWRAGIDVLALGATKNGALAAEAVVVFTRDLARTLPHRRARGGHLLSKARFIAAQLDAYFTDDLWLRHARTANAAAARLGAALTRVPGVRLTHPVEANLVFADLPPGLASALREEGYLFFDWPRFGPNVVRLVAGFATDAAAVDAFAAAALRAAGRL
jgi:threonine aldolase